MKYVERTNNEGTVSILDDSSMQLMNIMILPHVCQVLQTRSEASQISVSLRNFVFRGMRAASAEHLTAFCAAHGILSRQILITEASIGSICTSRYCGRSRLVPAAVPVGSDTEDTEWT